VRDLILARAARPRLHESTQRYQALTERRRWEELDLREVTRKRQPPRCSRISCWPRTRRSSAARSVCYPAASLVGGRARGRIARHPGRALRPRRAGDLLRRVWSSPRCGRNRCCSPPWPPRCSSGRSSTRTPCGACATRTCSLRADARELGEALPGAKEALIDERDAYLAQKIRDAEDASWRRSSVRATTGIRRALESAPVDRCGALPDPAGAHFDGNGSAGPCQSS
jgi:hypothetical protein